MNQKNRKYMKSAEFKARQSVFEFFCARSVEFLEAFKRNCIAGWGKIFTNTLSAAPKQLQLNLDSIMNIFQLIPQISQPRS